MLIGIDLYPAFRIELFANAVSQRQKNFERYFIENVFD